MLLEGALANDGYSSGKERRVKHSVMVLPTYSALSLHSEICIPYTMVNLQQCIL